MAVLFLLCVALLFVFFYVRKHDNPYKLTFIFGKKGAGKSLLLVYYMLKYRKRGWICYTDMKDVNIPGVRIIDVKDLEVFRPEPHSALFLDEVGISMDNRHHKDFSDGLRDFFKYLRKMECVCYMNSQAFDVDKKVRDTTDGMILQVSLGNVISISRPIIRSVTLTEATSQADSRIADNLRFAPVTRWKALWMPKYYKYFNSKEMPYRPIIGYTEPVSVVPVSDLKTKLRGIYFELTRKATDYFRG